MSLNLSFLSDLPSATVCTFKKGEFLINQGERVEHIYYLQKGVCEHIEYGPAGDEILYYQKRPNAGLESVIGLNHLWVSDSVAISSFYAKTDLVCIRVEAGEAKRAFLEHPLILDEIITGLAKKYIGLRSMFRYRHDRKIPAQLCRLLIGYAQSTQDQMIIPKSVSNVVLSRQLGAHQVTVAKIMSYLQKNGILKRTRDGIVIIDRQALLDYADGGKMDYLS